MKPMSRILLPIATLPLVVAATVLPGTVATAAAAPTASIGDVVCADADGTLTVELQAGDTEPATFTVLVDGSSSEEDTALDAGATGQVSVTALEDGAHTVEVLAFVGDADAATVATRDVSVACDVAPAGPYTNIKGAVYDACEYTGVVNASNKVVAGDTENLQAAEFEVAFTPTEDPTDDPSVDPGDGTDGTDGTDVQPDPAPRHAAVGVEEVLADFTLDAAHQTYESTFELGTTGDLVLRAGETVVASAHIGRCQVLAVPLSDAGGGDAVPDTGF